MYMYMYIEHVGPNNTTIHQSQKHCVVSLSLPSSLLRYCLRCVAHVTLVTTALLPSFCDTLLWLPLLPLRYFLNTAGPWKSVPPAAK